MTQLVSVATFSVLAITALVFSGMALAAHFLAEILGLLLSEERPTQAQVESKPNKQPQ